MGTVRIIVQTELPNGKGYAGDVVHVKAGYARNYLIPQKFAVYATRQNFERFKLKDPEIESPQEKRMRLERETEVDKDLKAADILKHYLRNKVLKIWRNVDSATSQVSPGVVDAKAVKSKLSKQLRIDLESHEKVHVSAEPLTEKNVDAIINAMAPVDTPCQVQIREVGDFMARISLGGGYSIPLKIEVIKR
jgi:ribosomal protein L9